MSSNAATPDHQQTPRSTATRGLKVLLADDSSFSQAVGRRFLEELGCVVDVVSSGQAAVDRASAHPYDVVFMDCQMPGMDGYEASRMIRLVPRLAGLPIVALTADNGSDARQLWLEAGATAFVSKPYRPDVLEAALRNISSQATGDAPSTAPLPASHQAVFQPAEAWERFDGDLELIGTILELIDRDLPESVRQLRRAVDAADWTPAARLAHTIKGTVGEVAAIHLSDLAVSMEQAALSADGAVAAAIVSQVETASIDLLAALHLWHAGLSTPAGPHTATA